jgi:hypothetical protein
MELIVNQKGNLTRPKAKFRNMLISAALSLVIVATCIPFQTAGFGETLDMLPWVALFAVLFVALQFLADLSEGEIEFDRRLKRVNINGRPTARYEAIRHVLIHEATPTDDGPQYQVTLRIGANRRLIILRTSSDADASTAAADIAREVGCEVIFEK